MEFGARIDRRTTLKWMSGALATAILAGCGEEEFPESAYLAYDEHGRLQPTLRNLGESRNVTGPGYGQDPNLINPKVPWERTMTSRQLAVVSRLGDIILPADDRSPAASAVGVPDYIDEWVSAPYPIQLRDRQLILSGLHNLEQECSRRYRKGFAFGPLKEREALVSEIFEADENRPVLLVMRPFLLRFRSLAVGVYYTSEAGIIDIGYLGNQPMSGDYPGPTPEALEHLEGVLGNIGLKLPTAG